MEIRDGASVSALRGAALEACLLSVSLCKHSNEDLRPPEFFRFKRQDSCFIHVLSPACFPSAAMLSAFDDFFR